MSYPPPLLIIPTMKELYNWGSNIANELSLKTFVRHCVATSRPSSWTQEVVSTAKNNLTHLVNLMDPYIKHI